MPGGRPVGECDERPGVRGCVAPGKTGQRAYGGFEELAGEDTGRVADVLGGTGVVAAPYALQEVQRFEEFGQACGVGHYGGGLVQPRLHQLGQVAAGGGGQSRQDLGRGGAALGRFAARGLAQGRRLPGPR